MRFSLRTPQKPYANWSLFEQKWAFRCRGVAIWSILSHQRAMLSPFGLHMAICGLLVPHLGYLDPHGASLEPLLSSSWAPLGRSDWSHEPLLGLSLSLGWIPKHFWALLSSPWIPVVSAHGAFFCLIWFVLTLMEPFLSLFWAVLEFFCVPRMISWAFFTLIQAHRKLCSGLLDWCLGTLEPFLSSAWIQWNFMELVVGSSQLALRPEFRVSLGFLEPASASLIFFGARVVSSEPPGSLK